LPSDTVDACCHLEDGRRAGTEITVEDRRRIHTEPLVEQPRIYGAEIELVDLPERETRLKEALAEALRQMRAALDTIASDYDFIFLDCPPSLSLLTLNGLCAADSVLIPMQCEYYALEGLSDLVQTIKKVRAHLNPTLEIEGLLRTMYDPRNTLALNVAAELERHFGDRLYRTVIPRNVRLAEAPSHGVPALTLEAKSKGALAYLALAGEVVRRMEHRTRPAAPPTQPAHDQPEQAP
jgi:chromosome partitioning protein